MQMYIKIPNYKPGETKNILTPGIPSDSVPNCAAHNG